MISTDFAPNEELNDAVVSFKTLFQPWKWNKGKEMTRAKNRVKSFFPNHEGYFFLSGRSALYNLLQALNLPKGSEVLLQAFTCEAVVLPVLALGLKPVYVDIEPKTLSMDPIDLKKKLSNKSKVIILQRTFGIEPMFSKEIQEEAKKHNLFYIDDLAHGFTGGDKTSLNGAIVLSFGRTKAFSSVFGGAIITRNKSLIKSLKPLHANLDLPPIPFIFKILLYKPLSVLIKKTYPFFVGKIIHRISVFVGLLTPEISAREKRGEFDPLLNRGFPNTCAVLLLNQLSRIQKISEKRQESVKEYEKKLRTVPGTLFHTQSSPLLRFPIAVKNRDELVKKAAKRQIYLGVWYNQVIAPKGFNLNKAFYVSGSCKQAEKVCDQILNLPTNISKRERAQVIRLFQR